MSEESKDVEIELEDIELAQRFKMQAAGIYHISTWIVSNTNFTKINFLYDK